MKRCPFFSRAYNAQCELKRGHAGRCVSYGDSFAGGYDPEDHALCAHCKEIRKEHIDKVQCVFGPTKFEHAVASPDK